MTEALLLYLFTRVDVLIKASVIAIIFSAMAMFILSMFANMEKGHGSAEIFASTWFKRLRNCIIACFVVLIIVPSQRDLAIIVGGTLAVHAAKSDTARKILDLANQVLDEELNKRTKKGR